MKWSPQQSAVFDWFRSRGGGHLCVRARAGTGKTTTMIEGLTRAPEPRILFCAFAKRNQEDAAAKLPADGASEAKTLNGLGWAFTRRATNNKIQLDRSVSRERADRAAGIPDTPENKSIRMAVVPLVEKLATKGKEILPLAASADELADLAYDFDCAPDEEVADLGWDLDRVCEAAFKAMDLAANDLGRADFPDQIFLPLRLGFTRPWYEMVIVDEAQDMNASQIALAQRACKKGGRIVVVGDDRQAIYGWRGADTGSLDRLKRELSATELGLTVTYRCPKRVVEMAQRLVPDYTAAAEAPDGLVAEGKADKLAEMAQPGDFVLSRTNAPLAGACLRLLRAGIRARVEGSQDVGKGLLALVNKLRAKSVKDLLAKLARWEERELRRAHASVADSDRRAADKRAERMLAVSDKAQTVMVLADGASGLPEVQTRIKALFEGSGPAVICSTVHKAKGLEADRTFLLMDTFYPGGRKSIEEDNVFYVALTRAKRELHLMTK